MARYIISPSQCKELYLLLPTEGISDEIKTIELPKEIFPWFDYSDLLIKLAKTDVQRNKDGFILIRNKPTKIKFDDFVHDCTKGNFKICYEPVFCELRECGITF